MAVLSLQKLVTQMRRVVLLHDDDVTDGQLLSKFVNEHDEAAFEVLVRRHGPMVLGVCRRLLGNIHDADDTFQATFLILVHKAASLKSSELVGNWLYGVAYNTALAARAKNVRRRSKEKQVNEMPEPAVMPSDDWSELRPLLDQQLSQLSDVYREAIVLCDLEGKTRKEAARKLGVPEGTMSSRLTTARRQLAKRLTRHGLTLTGGAVATIFMQNAASACVPLPLVISTVKAAAAVAAGSVTAGAVSPCVVTLTEGVLKTMFVNKAKTLTAVVLSFFLATGIILVGHVLAAPVPAQDKQEPKKDELKKDEAIIKTIITAGSGKVTIRQTGKETVGGVAVKVGDVKDGTLELKNSEDVVIEVKDFPVLVHTGSGCVVGESIKTKQAVVNMVMGCSGEVRLSGSADAQFFTHEGSGQIDGRKLQGKTAVVNILKTGEVTVNVTDTLQAIIAASGSVRYLGSPKVEKNVIGTGSVAPAK